MLEKYTLEGSIKKYGEVYSHLHLRYKRNRILDKWDKAHEKGSMAGQHCK